MEMDSIQKVAGAEQESQERREAAAAESRRTVAEARKAAEELLEEARRQAGAETRQMLARAEADAAEETKTILAEAGLSFLGLGISAPTASWGSMVSVGRLFLLQNPVFALTPGVCVAVLVICLNMFGDGVRDALDPRLRGEV